MREISADAVKEAVARLCIEANCCLGEDVKQALQEACEREESPLGKEALQKALLNAALAEKERMPLCQDTGIAVVWAEVGQEVRISGGNLADAINAGVRQGYGEGFLRPSIVAGLERVNTGDNTPAVIYYDLVPGEQLRITVAPKGAGSENMSGVKMLTPAEGIKGIKRFVVETVEKAGSNPCPPVVVGVGIGGTMDKAALLARRALLRPLGTPNPAADVAALEKELLKEINCLGIGPQGFGGRTTALAVHIEIYPTHIACLPVAVNLSCYCARHREVVL